MRGKNLGNRTIKEAKEVIDNGHPPMADKVALLDFDGTLYPFGHLFDFPPPIPGAVEFAQNLTRLGWKIIIFTSRLSPRWLESVGQEAWEHVSYISIILKRDGIHYEEITSEKVPGAIYIDDKAAPFEGDWAVTSAWFNKKFDISD